MDFFPLNDLPDWADNHFREIDEADSYMPSGQDPAHLLFRAAYRQWQQVVCLLHNTLITADERPFYAATDSLVESIGNSMMADALQVAIKMKCAQKYALYVLRMENAAVIRRCAASVYTQLPLLSGDSGIDQQYIDVVRLEIDTFRQLFKSWVATFTRDGFEDEWGVF